MNYDDENKLELSPFMQNAVVVPAFQEAAKSKRGILRTIEVAVMMARFASIMEQLTAELNARGFDGKKVIFASVEGLLREMRKEGVDTGHRAEADASEDLPRRTRRKKRRESAASGEVDSADQNGKLSSGGAQAPEPVEGTLPAELSDADGGLEEEPAPDFSSAIAKTTRTE